jgi:4-amino-4-deoxy-L-arabinose transferase-like glycosyltransferase
VRAEGASHAARWLLLAGLLLGLATLTRAVFLAFPLALVVFTLFAQGWRPGWKKALLLFGVYAAVVLSWTAYNVVRYQRLVIAGEGFASFVYLGATGWGGFAAVDERLDATLGPSTDGSRDQGEFLQAAGSSIGADLPGYLSRRFGELSGALLQPHNVELFHGPSLRRMLNEWWQSDRSVVGLVSVAGGSSFWPKLLLYVVHYTGLAFGLVGVLLTARAWRVGLPMLGYIGYVLLLHLVLFALPRYVFPITPFVWVFAATAIVILSHRRFPDNTPRMQRP